MARRTERAALELSESDREMLTTLSRSATAPAREVTRAKVLLRYAAGLSISQIQREVGVSRPTIYKCVDKALAAGVRTGLRDRYHRPREPEILPDAKAWVVSVACQQPKALGLAAELWTLSAHSGEIIADVEPRHRSREFVALLERLHRHYPPDAVIRVVLDNHSAHISRETMAYLATRPGRFEYVHTPKHGSWLNLIECAFSKMARTFLRHIRVASTAELKSRILQGIAEMNEAPVQLRWCNFDLDIA